MNEKRTIGFVILVWNSEKVIASCLDSIVALNEVFPYVVIVDNGSTDNTARIVKTYVEKYPKLFEQVSYEQNMGTTKSRNAGIKILYDKSVDYYCILDSDTQVSDVALITMIEELNANEKYGLIGPKMHTSEGQVQMSARAFPTLVEKILKAFPSERMQAIGYAMEEQRPSSKDVVSYPVDYLMSACWLIKPETIDIVGLLDENIFYAPEDAEYCIRIWKSGYQVAYCPEAEIIHEWQRLSKRKLVSKMNYEHIKGLIYMFVKHKYLFSTKSIKKRIIL